MFYEISNLDNPNRSKFARFVPTAVCSRSHIETEFHSETHVFVVVLPLCTDPRT